MFETTGRTDGGTRKTTTLQKLERMRKALRHHEPDRVPISDFFWGGFLRRWRKELDLPPDANPYYHYDLDWIVTVPNMDPWIRPFQTLAETLAEVVVKTGFGAIMYFEYVGRDFAADMAKMAADPTTRKWWEVCMLCQQPLPDRGDGQWWASMDEVFHWD